MHISLCNICRENCAPGKEIHSYYCLQNAIRLKRGRRVRFAHHRTCLENSRYRCVILVEKPERKRSCGKATCRGKNDVKNCLQVVG